MYECTEEHVSHLKEEKDRERKTDPLDIGRDLGLVAIPSNLYESERVHVTELKEQGQNMKPTYPMGSYVFGGTYTYIYIHTHTHTEKLWHSMVSSIFTDFS